MGPFNPELWVRVFCRPSGCFSSHRVSYFFSIEVGIFLSLPSWVSPPVVVSNPWQPDLSLEKLTQNYGCQKPSWVSIWWLRACPHLCVLAFTHTFIYSEIQGSQNRSINDFPLSGQVKTALQPSISIFTSQEKFWCFFNPFPAILVFIPSTP